MDGFDKFADGAILVFINGIEPDSGRKNLEDIVPNLHDTVVVGYANRPYWGGY